MDDILKALGAEEEWSDDGYGPFDSNLIHNECGTMIEPDADECPVCHVSNPIRAAGMI